jgi:hypothetical protein
MEKDFGKQLEWFIGVVEDRMDPEYMGRVKVRCLGHHTENKTEILTEDLSWSTVMAPTPRLPDYPESKPKSNNPQGYQTSYIHGGICS